MRLYELTEGLRDPEDNPCWKGYKPVGTKKKAGRTVPNCVPAKESVEEDVNDDMPDLEQEGEPVKSIEDAERRMAAGDRIFAFHEMDEEPFEIVNVGDLAGYTYDQLLVVPADMAESSDSKRLDLKNDQEQAEIVDLRRSLDQLKSRGI
jgi:hypothetical protein